MSSTKQILAHYAPRPNAPQRVKNSCVRAWDREAKESKQLTLSPSPQKKFLVRMFMYGYSVRSSMGGSCDLCSQCSSHRRQALTPPMHKAGMTT